MKEQKRVPKLRFVEFSDEWKAEKVGMLGTFKGGGTPSTNNSEYWQGETPWISSSDIKENDIHNINISRYLSELGITESATKVITKGSILFVARVGIGKLAVANQDLCTSQDFANLIPRKDDSYYIAYYFMSKGKLLFQYSQGTSIKGFTTGDLKSIPINIPTLPEQQKIASFLSSVDKKIAQLQQKKSLLEHYKKGVMQQTFSQELRFTRADGSAYPDWEEKRLGDFCKFFSGGTPRSTNKKFYSGTIPFIGSGNISDEKVDNYISENALNSSSAKLVDKGDLLYALYGATSGEVALSKINGAINQAVMCIRTTADKKYLYQILKYNKDKIVKTYIQGGQGNLSGKIVRDLKFYFPCIEEQTQIANFLSAIDKKIAVVQTLIAQTQTFKKGLLQQMFV